jgi:NodT family efflux transporter outer membrane factor (OMF) lipoprotein
MKRALESALFVLACGSGCTVGPDYVPPSPAMPAAFSEAPRTPSGAKIVPGAEALRLWWMSFQDPTLDSLITRAVANNRDLRMAVSRIRQARAERGIASAAFYPAVGLSAGGNVSRGSENVVIPAAALGVPSGSVAKPRSLASGTPPAVGGPVSPFGLGGLPGVTTTIYQAGFDASWEIDVFGGTRRAVESADAGIGSAEEDQRLVLVSLTAEVAARYVAFRGLQDRARIARENLASQQSALGITRDKQTAGLATDLEVSRQAAQVALTASLIPSLESSERDELHALAYLLAVGPADLDAELLPERRLPPLPQEVPIGLPSDLLRRRPDVRRAERELARATAEVGVATADLYPKFSITGLFGVDSSHIRDLPKWSSRYFTLAPGVTWPVLDWGRIRGTIAVRTELQEQALLAYENAVSLALKEVDDALAHYLRELDRRTALADAVAASRRAMELSRQRYEQGFFDQLAVIDSQRALLVAEDSYSQSDGALRTHLVALFKALGGGWEP